MAQTNVQAFSGDVEIANGTNHSLTIDASSSLIYNKVLTFTSISADSYNYVGRFSIYAPPAIFSIVDSGSSLGSGSRYSMAKQYGAGSKPIMNALEGSLFTDYTFVWQANGEESYDVWFKPNRAGNYIVYVHAKDYTFPTAPGSPTYLDVLYGLVNLSDSYGGLAHAIIGAPSAYGNASLQLFNNGQVTGDRLTHEAIQLFSNTTPATGDISNVYITMTPSTVNNGYGGYIEGWNKAGTDSGLTIGSINEGTKYAGITVVGTTANVGIGTNAPERKLDIWQSAADVPLYQRIQNVQNNAGCGIELMRGDGTTFGATAYSDWRINNSADLDFGVKFTDTDIPSVLHLDTTGNVGIGTTDPATKLQVGSSGETGPQYIRIRGNRVNEAGDICGLQMYNSANSGDRGNSAIINSRGTDNYASALQFWTNPGGNTPATQKMVIDQNGNVGIGTTSPIGTLSVVRDTVVADLSTFQRGMFYKDGKLQITPPDLYSGYPLNGDFLTTTRYLNNATTDFTGAAFGVDYVTTGSGGSSLYFKTASSQASLTEKVRITDTGNVGIGTDSPGQKLSIYTGSTTTAGLSIDRYSTGNYRTDFYQADTGLAIHVGNASDTPTEKMRIHHNGNVGIGTTDPGTTLDVNGNLRIRTRLYMATESNFGHLYKEVKAGAGDITFTVPMRAYCNWKPAIVNLKASRCYGSGGGHESWQWKYAFRHLNCNGSDGQRIIESTLDGANPGTGYLVESYGASTNYYSFTFIIDGRNNMIAEVEMISFGGIYF
jgi:hypothetical protein